jgi:hypothetical protein
MGKKHEKALDDFKTQGLLKCKHDYRVVISELIEEVNQLKQALSGVIDVAYRYDSHSIIDLENPAEMIEAKDLLESLGE